MGVAGQLICRNSNSQFHSAFCFMLVSSGHSPHYQKVREIPTRKFVMKLLVASVFLPVAFAEPQEVQRSLLTRRLREFEDEDDDESDSWFSWYRFKIQKVLSSQKKMLNFKYF